MIGPNGSGKTTLLKTIAQILKPIAGTIESQINDKPIYLSANQFIQDGLTVHDLLDLFETKNSKWFSDQLLSNLHVHHLINESVAHISSGERQRVLLACVLGHPSDFVILDEPLSFLDWHHSFTLFDLIQSQRLKRFFLIANHNLEWSLKFNQTSTWVLHQKSLVLEGSTESVLTSPKLMEIFKIKTKITDNEIDKTKHLMIAQFKENSND